MQDMCWKEQSDIFQRRELHIYSWAVQMCPAAAAIEE